MISNIGNLAKVVTPFNDEVPYVPAFLRDPSLSQLLNNPMITISNNTIVMILETKNPNFTEVLYKNHKTSQIQKIWIYPEVLMPISL